MEHELKINKCYLERLMSREKKAEIRCNDRDYQIGDTLEFFNGVEDDFVYFKITHVHSGLGLKENYVCLSVERVVNG